MAGSRPILLLLFGPSAAWFLPFLRKLTISPWPPNFLVVQVAALGWDLVKELPGFRPAEAFFPAVTSLRAGGFRTGCLPRAHGMVANGVHLPDLRKILLLGNNPPRLVEGERIWSRSAPPATWWA